MSRSIVTFDKNGYVVFKQGNSRLSVFIWGSSDVTNVFKNIIKHKDAITIQGKYSSSLTWEYNSKTSKLVITLDSCDSDYNQATSKSVFKITANDAKKILEHVKKIESENDD